MSDLIWAGMGQEDAPFLLVPCRFCDWPWYFGDLYGKLSELWCWRCSRQGWK